LPLSRGTVVHREDTAPLQEIIATIESLGYGAKAGERTAQQNLEPIEHREKIQRLRKAFANAAVVASMISGLETVLWLPLSLLTARLLGFAVAGLAVWTQMFDAIVIHRAAWRRGLTASLTMDSLVSLS